MHSDQMPFPGAPRIGHPQMDEDHEHFLVLIANVQAAPVDERLSAFDTLFAHARTHFAAEDEIMAPHDFASKECHVDEHRAVLVSFGEVRQALVDGRIDVLSSFLGQLAAWLPEHVDALDRQLAKFVFFKQTGGAPVLIRRLQPSESLKP
jgi:hemerythrin